MFKYSKTFQLNVFTRNFIIILIQHDFISLLKLVNLPTYDLGDQKEVVTELSASIKDKEVTFSWESEDKQIQS